MANNAKAKGGDKKAAPKPAAAAKKAGVAPKEPAAAKGEGKPGRKRSQQAVTPDQAKKAMAAIKAGNTTLLAQSKSLGYSHNGPLRSALRTLLGAAGYDKLMEGQRRGPVPAGKKAAGKPAAGKPAAKKAAKPAPAAPAEGSTYVGNEADGAGDVQ